jgi:vitamin B12 transporter
MYKLYKKQAYTPIHTSSFSVWPYARRRFTFVAPAALVLWASAAQAAETASKDALDLPVMTVTANREATPLAKSGSAVTVITRDDIEKTQATAVIDVLRTVPGVQVSQYGGPGKQAAVRLRGAPAHHTLVLIDGMEVADTSSAQQSYDFGHLMVTDIERIEVLRGPQSTLYGADAIGGVVHIITRKGKGALQGRAALEIGSFNTQNLMLAASGAADKIDYAVSVNGYRSNGFNIAHHSPASDEDDGYKNITLNTRFGAQLSENVRIDTALRYMHSDVETDAWVSGRAADSNDEMRKKELAARAALTFDTFGKTLQHVLAVNHTMARRDGYTTNDQRTWFYDGWKDKLEYQGTWRRYQGHTVVFGMESETEFAETGPEFGKGQDDSVTSNGFYGNYLAEITDDATLSAGVRVDAHQDYGTNFTYRLTGSYAFPAYGMRLHSSVGTGFRAPSLFELYDPTYGNAALDPEKSLGFDFGVAGAFLNDKLHTDITLFHTRTTNLIQWAASGYTNVGKTLAKGIEAQVQADILPTLSIDATYTYTNAKNTQTDQSLARTPDHTASVGVTYWALDDLETQLRWRGASNTRDSATNNKIGGYGVFDVKARYLLNDHIALKGRVENLLDKRYEEYDTYATSGVAVYAGVDVAF